VWVQAIDAAQQATAAVGAHHSDPAQAADAAWAASDFLAANVGVDREAVSKSLIHG
jgi:hypothetical protein